MDDYLNLDANEYTARPLGIITNELSAGPVFEISSKVTLKTLLKNKNLSLAMKAKVLLDTAKGMDYLHSKGFVHRGLNLESLLCYSFNSKDDVVCK